MNLRAIGDALAMALGLRRGWRSHQNLTWFVIRDRVRLGVFVSAAPTPGGGWNCIALESAIEHTSLGAIFDHHAHVVIEEGVPLAVALEAGETYARGWRRTAAAPPACGCEPIAAGSPS